MAGPVALRSGRFTTGTPVVALAVRTRPMTRLDAYQYDVASDGQRFIVNAFVDEPATQPITLLANWPALLKK